MKLTIESTERTVLIREIKHRVWEGVTDTGVPCTLYVRAIAVASDQDWSQFAKELKPVERSQKLREILPIEELPS